MATVAPERDGASTGSLNEVLEGGGSLPTPTRQAGIFPDRHQFRALEPPPTAESRSANSALLSGAGSTAVRAPVRRVGARLA